ncbi:MAG: hypothetical protein HY885_08260 [Deltaproteobacteria bacterium]|nr:hypothetical protein [Deltaproteobacteria bacterium]
MVMRFILPFLLFILLFPLPLRAEYFLRGRVIAVEREKGEITLAAIDCDQCLHDAPGAAKAKPENSMPPEKENVFVISTDFIPTCVAPDVIIQVWGELSGAGENRMQARRVTGPNWQHGQDSTGVRSRLRKRCFIKPNSGAGPGEP